MALKRVEESPGVQSLAKPLHDIAAGTSILFGQVSCRGCKLMPYLPQSRKLTRVFLSKPKEVLKVLLLVWNGKQIINSMLVCYKLSYVLPYSGNAHMGLAGLDWFGFCRIVQGLCVIHLRAPYPSESVCLASPSTGQSRASKTAYSHTLQGWQSRISWQTWRDAVLILNLTTSIHHALNPLPLPMCDSCLFPYICFYHYLTLFF